MVFYFNINISKNLIKSAFNSKKINRKLSNFLRVRNYMKKDFRIVLNHKYKKNRLCNVAI